MGDTEETDKSLAVNAEIPEHSTLKANFLGTNFSLSQLTDFRFFLQAEHGQSSYL